MSRTTANDVRVLAAVVQADGRYLIGIRPTGKRHGGLWEFPGGKVHEGEDDFAAVTRELKEELDLDVIRVGNLLFESRDPGSPYLIQFVPVVARGTPKRLEHEQLYWATLEELVALPLAPVDRAFVKQFLRGVDR